MSERKKIDTAPADVDSALSEFKKLVDEFGPEPFQHVIMEFIGALPEDELNDLLSDPTIADAWARHEEQQASAAEPSGGSRGKAGVPDHERPFRRLDA